ncbi:MAG: LPS assembly protein LptD [Akkermansiaceae bacterium]|nr:LPS assembly protein LptD [Akkermansiaceae bacterium]
MLKIGAWIISPLLLLPLSGQIQPGPEVASSTVDTITPVPPMEFSLGLPGAAPMVMPQNLNISNFGGGLIEGVKDVGLRYHGPGIKITGDNGMEAFADTALVDVNAKTATLEGNVSIYQGNILQRGERTVYFYEKKLFDVSDMRASMDPILLEADKFTAQEQGTKKTLVGENAGITTDDSEDPGYWLRAKKTTVFPGDKIVFNDLRVYAGDVPVFWLPYLSQPLDKELGYHFVPGSRSGWGPFLLNTYGIMLGGETDPKTGENEDSWLLSRWHFDLRAQRGIGSGVDFVDTRVENINEVTGLSLYYLHDLAPETSTTGVPRGTIDADRYQVELKHRLDLDFEKEAEWSLDSNFTLLSDQYYLEDFNLGVYRTDPAPDNTLGLYRRDDDSLLSIYGRFRINDFYRTDTRSPEVFFDQVRSPLLDSPVLHEGNISFGLIGEKAADFADGTFINPLMELTAGDPTAQSVLNQLNGYQRQLAEELIALPLNDPRREAIRTQFLDSSYARLNVYQELSMPMTFGEALYVTPIAGLGYTRYDAANWTIANTDRTYLHAGTEISTKFSKEVNNQRNSSWGLDGLKHILQPYASWSLVSTDSFSVEDPQVDRLTPTTRPRPLDPVRFNAVDQLETWNVVRFGTRNRFLTKRDNQAFEWLYFETYMDAFIQDPEGRRDYSNLYNEARWQPLPWVSAGLETQFPINNDPEGFSQFNSTLRFMPTQSIEFSFAYLILNGHPNINDSNQLTLQSYLRLNDNWGLGGIGVVELDDGTLQQQQFTLHRDLGNWVAGVGVTVLDNRLQKEYGMVFNLTLKDFPSAALPFTITGQQ